MAGVGRSANHGNQLHNTSHTENNPITQSTQSPLCKAGEDDYAKKISQPLATLLNPV